MLVGPSKYLKQIFLLELNRVKNLNWPDANQLAIYKRDQGIWTRDYREQIQLAVRAGLELGASKLQVRCSNHSATLPWLTGQDEMNPVFWLSTWEGRVGLSCPTLGIYSFFRKNKEDILAI